MAKQKLQLKDVKCLGKDRNWEGKEWIWQSWGIFSESRHWIILTHRRTRKYVQRVKISRFGSENASKKKEVNKPQLAYHVKTTSKSVLNLQKSFTTTSPPRS